MNMSRITSCTSQIDICSWTRTNQEQIQGHPAWHGDIDAVQAEALLQGNDSFSYLLRKGEEENAYFISFVKEDLSIKHQRFTLEHDRKGWYFKNGITGTSCHLDKMTYGPTEIVAETSRGLIPQMMHCDDGECKAIKRSKN
jgi:hypothetical protein